MIRPSHSPITLHFGATTDPYSPVNPHRGCDFSYKPDSTVYMPEDGAILYVPNNGKDGNAIYFTVGNRQHGLLHLDHLLVPASGVYKQGTPIAIMGSTGFAQGVHLHHALKVDGVFADPEKYYEDKEDNVPPFNEGDRSNINVYLFGRDEKKFGGAVNKDWKNAMYYGVFETPEFKVDQLVNKGDVDVINSTFGRTDGATMVGKTWKRVFYEYTIPNINKPQFKQLPPGVYEVKE